ncbi:MAG: hypothetical protein WCX91_04650, partial [Candidatus Omnitrophota bacterium]
ETFYADGSNPDFHDPSKSSIIRGDYIKNKAGEIIGYEQDGENPDREGYFRDGEFLNNRKKTKIFSPSLSKINPIKTFAPNMEAEVIRKELQKIGEGTLDVKGGTDSQLGAVVGGLSAVDLAVEIEYIMNMLGINDYNRVMQIFKTSVDPVAFVDELCRLVSKGQEEVLGVLDGVEFFKIIAARYRLIKVPSFDKSEFSENSLEINVSAEGYVFPEGKPGAADQPLSAYLNLAKEMARKAPFVFRDEMQKFVGRFMGLITADTSDPDLLWLLDLVIGYLDILDLNRIKYIFTSGIGANEMYSHQLARILNIYFESRGIKVRWIVVNNPAHLEVIPEDADSANSIVFEMSRSGSTKETVDFFNATKNRLKNRIVAANTGKLKDAALKLKDEEGAHVLIIDNIPGDIGGRQMNRKTLMVFIPLFVALAAGVKDLDAAKGLLKSYCVSLFDANEKLSYDNGSNSAAVRMAEFLYRQRASGRMKFSVIHHDSLKGAAKELFQLTNEGANKNIAGSSNNNVLDIYSLNNDRERFEAVFSKAAGSQLSVFLLDKSSPDYAEGFKYAQDLNRRGVPCVIISIDITEDLKDNLGVIAKTSALLQDAVVYFTFLTNQDANSNPAVKFVREITAAIFEIVEKKKENGITDIRITFAEIMDKIAEKEKEAVRDAVKSVDTKNISKSGKSAGEFAEFISAIEEVSGKLGLQEEDSAVAFVRSVSGEVVQTDVGEAGGCKIQVIKEAFRRSKIGELLGELSCPRLLASLNKQLVVADGRIRVSLAGREDGSYVVAGATLAEQLADYLVVALKERKEELMYMTLTFMEVDNNNPAIKEIAKSIVDKFAVFNITSPLLALPGVAHTGIEAVMSHPESIFNIAIMYTNAYGSGLGTTPIGKNITVDDATYVYGVANVVRMALAGTPSIIFEARNRDDLKFIKEVLMEALSIAINRGNDMYSQEGAVGAVTESRASSIPDSRQSSTSASQPASQGSSPVPQQAPVQQNAAPAEKQNLNNPKEVAAEVEAILNEALRNSLSSHQSFAPPVVNVLGSDKIEVVLDAAIPFANQQEAEFLLKQRLSSGSLKIQIIDGQGKVIDIPAYAITIRFASIHFEIDLTNVGAVSVSKIQVVSAQDDTSLTASIEVFGEGAEEKPVGAVVRGEVKEDSQEIPVATEEKALKAQTALFKDEAERIDDLVKDFVGNNDDERLLVRMRELRKNTKVVKNNMKSAKDKKDFAKIALYNLLGTKLGLIVSGDSNASKEIARHAKFIFNKLYKNDPSRPVPGQPMPTRNEVNTEINMVGWENTQALVADAAEIKLAVSYLRSINENPMADYLEYIAEAGLIRAGP